LSSRAGCLQQRGGKRDSSIMKLAKRRASVRTIHVDMVPVAAQQSASGLHRLSIAASGGVHLSVVTQPT
jgi:hypothetical protein